MPVRIQRFVCLMVARAGFSKPSWMAGLQRRCGNNCLLFMDRSGTGKHGLSHTQITDPYGDSSTAIFHSGFGLHQFNLEVRDDKGRIASDQVSIQVVPQFDYAYDELSWDSSINGLLTISVKFKPGLMETWPTGRYRYVYFKISRDVMMSATGKNCLMFPMIHPAD